MAEKKNEELIGLSDQQLEEIARKQEEQDALYARFAELGDNKGTETGPRKKNLWLRVGIAVAVLVLLIVGITVVIRVLPKPEAEDYTSVRLTLGSHEISEVEGIQIANDSGEFEFYYELDDEDEAAWTIRGYEDYRLDADKVADVGELSLLMTAYEVIRENAAAEDLAEFGLDTPASVMTVKLKDGSSETYRLGDRVPGGTMYYLTKDGDPNVYACWMNIGMCMSRALNEYWSSAETTYAIESLLSVDYSVRGSFEASMRYEMDEEIGKVQWYFLKPYYVATDTDRLEDFLVGLQDLKMDTAVATHVTDDQLAEYGLDDPKMTLKVVDQANTRFELIVGDDIDNYYCYCKVDDEPTVYRVSQSAVDFINTPPLELMQKYVMLAMLETVDAVDISGLIDMEMSITHDYKLDEDGNPEINSSGYQLYDRKFYVNGERTDGDLFKNTYAEMIGIKLNAVLAEEEIPDTLQDPVLTIRYNRDSAALKEMKIEYIPLDQDRYLVRRNDEETPRFTVLQKDVRYVVELLDELLFYATE